MSWWDRHLLTAPQCHPRMISPEDTMDDLTQKDTLDSLDSVHKTLGACHRVEIHPNSPIMSLGERRSAHGRAHAVSSRVLYLLLTTLSTRQQNRGTCS